jgi:hypothetical protein
MTRSDDGYTVRVMRPEEIALAVEWAAGEADRSAVYAAIFFVVVHRRIVT